MKLRGIVAAVTALTITGALAADTKNAQKAEKKNTQTSGKDTKVTDKLEIVDHKVGDGAEAKAGNRISVHYTGTLTDGTKFDSSKDRGQPFTFKLGVGQVIKGWDEGFNGMKVGGVRKLTIPASMGYGNRPAGSIPPNSTLIFEVELLGVES
jgi:FKBP-type peptidyl-prolyl cis-trans isomerase